MLNINNDYTNTNIISSTQLNNILAIESSCDETAIAIYNNHEGLLAHSLYSQIALHQNYGGVVPELASRDHLIRIIPLINLALKQAGINLNQVHTFVYTKGPGLAGALLIGASIANSLAYAMQKPIIGIHHLEGHILSPLLALEKPNFPFICLLVSGGNTQLILVKEVGEYILLGETLDDSAGEAFDKTAKLLGLPYPGGPQVSILATKGQDIYNFPRPMQYSKCLDFSFSGLKTAVLTQINRLGGLPKLSETNKANICASFIEACTDILSLKALKALKFCKEEYKLNDLSLVVAGGVSANIQLRNKLDSITAQNNYKVYYPPLKWCTDNAAMIALAASLNLAKNPNKADYNYNFEIKPRWDLV